MLSYEFSLLFFPEALVRVDINATYCVGPAADKSEFYFFIFPSLNRFSLF